MVLNYTSDLYNLEDLNEVQAFIDKLSKREYRVLKLSLEELSCKEMAEQLFVEVSTIEKHRKQIIKKLGIRGQTKFRQALRKIDRAIRLLDLRKS